MSEDFDPMTPEAKRQLKADGYRLVHSEFGQPGTGKTTRAKAKAEAFVKAGKAIYINDGVIRGGRGGVELWVRQ